MSSEPADFDALFDAVLDRPPEERRPFLDAQCGRDTPLRQQIDRLLREADDTEAFLRPGGALQGVFGAALAADLAGDDGLPLESLVGPYRLVAELARGGMAIVYLAERTDGAFSQQVALKVVKRGIDTDEVFTRFRQERQILASLDHPDIARLLDGGVTPDGRPYLAMELVRGEPLDVSCDRRGLDVDGRVDACLAVARAVQHAHQRLVVHRDLKPSNILVTGDGAIKLLDFGIAKLLDPASFDDAAPPTRTALRVMTPEFASPEQVRGEPITTASDVYQIGLILFELLTGRRAQPLRGLTTAEAERVVCLADAPRASSAIAERTPAARKRRRQVQGDLDRIVAAALQKSPARRYASVGALIEDLERYRQRLPVKARGDSWAYRAGKFVSRHRAALAAAVVVLLVVAAIVTFYNRRLAAERDQAQREAATATHVAEFLASVFRSADPMRPSDSPTTVREVLDRSAARIDDELAGQPEVQARLMNVMGNTYQALGLSSQAVPLLERSLALRRAQLGGRHRDVALGMQQLGLALYSAGRTDDARPVLEAALALQEEVLGPTHDDLAATLSTLGLLHRRAGRLEEARDLLERALGLRERALGPEAAPLAVTLNNLALTHTMLRSLPRAKELLERALAIHERHRGPDHPLVAGTAGNLADVLRLMGDLDGAGSLHARAVAITEKALGPDHVNTASAANAFGQLLLDQRRFDEARHQFERAAGIYERAGATTHANYAYPLENLGHVFRATGDLSRARQHYERGLRAREAALGPVHRLVSQSLYNLAMVVLEIDGCGTARPTLARALDVSRQTLPPDHGRISELGAALGRCTPHPG